MREKYETLLQGQMTVIEYYRRFEHVSYYSIYETERDRVEQFKKGLTLSVQHKVGAIHFETVLQAVESATMTKFVCHRLRKEEGEKRKGDNISGNHFINHLTNQNKVGQQKQQPYVNQGQGLIRGCVR